MGNFYSKFVRSGILFAFREGNPKCGFEEQTPPPAPDYDDESAWGALPDKDGAHRFEVCFNVVILCEDATLAEALALKAVLENTIQTHRSGNASQLQNAIRRIKVVIRYIPAVSVTASGLASFASLQTDFRHALSRPSGMVVRESCDPSELQHLDVVTSSALVFLLSEKYRRKCKMRFAAHAHKFVDDDHIEELLGRARCSGDLDIPAAPADIEHAATPPAKGLSTLKPSAIKAPHREWATLCDRAREIAQHLFTRLIPQVSADEPGIELPVATSVDNACLVEADGSAQEKAVRLRRTVDVFFVHPTGFFGSRWNGPFDNPKAQAACDTVLASQLSIFQQDCNLYLPRYRQATFTSYFNNNKDSRQAFELAYSDVKRAFHNFLDRVAAETGGDSLPRPFILASHSQGGHHLIRLLEEEVEPVHSTHGDLFQRCVCVYIVGSKIPMDKLDPVVGLRRFRMSRTAKDLNCLVAWDTCTVPRGVVTHPKFVGYWYRDGWRVARPDEAFIATNPLNWKSVQPIRETSGVATDNALELGPSSAVPAASRALTTMPARTLATFVHTDK
eukprot:INCI14789.6.p1 GENE.INCI14789.6~~INCI14789.6.p1  ORF type:complete len:562 (-),score=83.81 INCI14789.6:526-2211(-)